MNTYPHKIWKTGKKPELFGYLPEHLERAKKYCHEIGSAAVMIVVDGEVLFEYGETARKFNCHSIRKSFLSALYGIYIERGNLKRDMSLEKLNIDDTKPSLTKQEKQATLVDLLKSRSGVYHEANYETDSAKAERPQRGSHAPGTFWYYNNWDFNVLGTIFNRKAGIDLFRAFQQEIALPLQMEDFDLTDCWYEKPDADSIHLAYLFTMTARDMARFGLLYLNKGNWNGKQIIPDYWVSESSRVYSHDKFGHGFGYMWWVASNGNLLPNLTFADGTIEASGYRGHYLLVIPEKNMVVVHRYNTDQGGVEKVTSDQLSQLLKIIF